MTTKKGCVKMKNKKMNPHVEVIYTELATLHRQYWDKGTHKLLAEIDQLVQQLEKKTLELDSLR
jgi:hypothetical protein